MPLSRSRKKQPPQPPPRPTPGAAGSTREPVKVGSGRWVAPVMVACLVIGLAWIVVFYLAGTDIPGMRDLGYWNLAIGMGLILAGLVAAMKWE
ncbi:MAG: cell division protein CrgA [Actinomycetota bacterium]|nr:cell division protein CrgA [Actinomycetota bacterium]